MTGETVDRTVEVVPETITVRPQPLLDLDYFLPGYVYADDPLTPEIEPVVPFTLGVRITNSGAGAAVHTRIESAQPRIVENEQGLLIGFQIESSYVDDQPSQPSLLIDFGTIAPGASRMGRWSMTTTLSGQFYDFSAEYTHADDLGGALTSLLNPPRTYLLTHDVLVDVEGHDGIRDFLAQAVNAQDADPYGVYESDGPVSDVVQQFNPTFSGSTLSFPAVAQGLLVYARASIGFDGQSRTVSALRSDGRPVNPANVWFSKRRTPGGNGWQYFLNLFEANPASCPAGSCSYALTYDGAPSNASIAGVVYEDVNANGIQDPGEQGLVGVSVTLSNGGAPQNVATAANGAFQFSALPPGTYALTVGPADGHSDGSHGAGTAGGIVGASGISGIVLEADTHASGYLFAKVPQSGQARADLSISAFTASTLMPKVDETFTVTLQVANKGPDSALVDAGISIPSALSVLSANPSSGTFNAATGQWLVGDLAATGSATLTLQVRASTEGDTVLSASVGAADLAVVDPDPSNNTGLLTVQVQPATAVHLDAELSRETRMLVFVGCMQRSTNPCFVDRSTSLDAYLTRMGVEHIVTTDPAEFTIELRSGRWNAYWVDDGVGALDSWSEPANGGPPNGPGGLSEDVLAELGMAIFRGDSLLLDATGNWLPQVFSEWADVIYDSQRSTSAEAVTFQSNPYLAFEGLTVAGEKPRYKTPNYRKLATYPGTEPAVVLSNHGNGRVLLFAFDLVNKLDSDASLDPLFAQIVSMLRPQLPDFFTADAYVSATFRAENTGPAVAIDEAVDVPPGSRWIKADPAPSNSSENQVGWSTNLAGSDVFKSAIGLRVPSANGTHALAARVTESGGAAELLAEQSLPLIVYGTSELGAIVESDINGMVIPAGPDADARATAITAVQGALASRSDGNLNDAIAQLLVADAALASIASTYVNDSRATLAWLLQALEREWFVALSTCDASGVSVVRDSGLSFVPYGENRGLYEHQGNGSQGWELGWDTRGRESVHLDDSSAGAYRWSLSYDGSGNASLSVYDGTSIVGEITYWGLNSVIGGSRPLETGNAIRLSVGAGIVSPYIPPPPPPLISVSASELNGVALSDSIATDGVAGTELFYYGEGMADGFVLSGTIQLDRAARSGYSYFEVHAGGVSCRMSGR